MRKYLKLIATLVIGVFAFSVSAQAVVDDTESVSASAIVAGAAQIVSVTPAAITYTTTGINTFPDEGGVTIVYNSNYDPWQIVIYTNNLVVPNFNDGGTPGDPSDDTGRYSKGGLVKSDGTEVIPMRWVCQDDATVAPNIADIDGYNYVKDKRDQDDPATGGDDESWLAAFTDGYANIAFGGATYGWCVDPTEGDLTGDAADGSIDVYLATLFGDVTPGAGSFNSNVYFDLYHE